MKQLRANALLITAAFLWGVGNVAQKTVLDDLGPLTAVGLRCLIGGIVIWPFVKREFQSGKPVSWHDWAGSGVTGILFSGAMGLQQASYGATSVTNASFLISTTTVMTPLATWVLSKDRPAPALWLYVALAISGTLLMSGGSPVATTWGDGGCLVSAAFYSVWFVVLGGVVRRTGRPGLLTITQFSIAAAVCLIIGLVLEPITILRLTGAAPELLFLGVFATGIAFGLQSIAQQYTSASTAAILTSGESVFGAACGYLVLDERLGAAATSGACLVAASIIFVQIDLADAYRGLRFRCGAAAIHISESKRNLNEGLRSGSVEGG